MLSAKYAALTMAVMLAVLAGNAQAQWTPGGMMVYMGDLNLQAPSASSPSSVQSLGGSSGVQAAMASSLNNSSINGTSINGTAIDNSTMAAPAIAGGQAAALPSGKEVLDLSSYSTDRANRNLAGYKNIMYPITGARGTTTSTAGGGGGGCGCG